MLEKPDTADLNAFLTEAAHRLRALVRSDIPDLEMGRLTAGGDAEGLLAYVRRLKEGEF